MYIRKAINVIVLTPKPLLAYGGLFLTILDKPQGIPLILGCKWGLRSFILI